MPSARLMRSLPLSEIRLTDPFLSRWQTALLEKGLAAQHKQLVDTHRFRNFENAAKGEGEFEGLYFNDCDVYKWIEACAYALVRTPDAAVRKLVDDAIDTVAKAQEPDGYLNTFFQIKHPTLKWRNLGSMHEMYCCGHLIEAAVAMFECLGDRRLIDVSVKWMDLVMSLFGPSKRKGICGHEELELALLRLAKATGEQKYADFAQWQVEERGTRPSVFEEELKDDEAVALQPYARQLLLKDGHYTGEYAQDHAPIREHTDVVGHAVRAMYFYIAAAEIGIETNDPTLQEAIERCWANLTQKRMYVTGGIGPSASNEGFTTDYDLPNLTAYAETCAAVGLIMWAHKMLEVTGNSEYADIMERALYNGAISGISLDTEHYFYTNPLESRGTHKRTPWFTCACCPPNIARLIGSLGAYAVGVGEEALYVHLPIGFETTATLNGVRTKLRAESNYPWSGKFTLHVDPEKPVEAEVRFRIPDWAEDVESEIPGLEEPAEYDNGYIVIRKQWKPGDVAKFDIELKPKWVAADPRVKDNLGRLALTYGPLIYAAEQHDTGYAPQTLSIDAAAEITTAQEKMLNGITTLTVEAVREKEEFADQLYGSEDLVAYEETKAKFIPYYAWCNRGPNHMQVWVRRL